MMSMQTLLSFLHLSFLYTVVAQLPIVAPPFLWTIPDLRAGSPRDGAGDFGINSILSNGSIRFGFYTMNRDSFILSVFFEGLKNPVIWSANSDNPVSGRAILNFTSEEGLLLYDDDGTLIWSIGKRGMSVAGMRLDASGNLVLFDKNSFSVWQSFDHHTDTLVLGQSLCSGMNLSTKTSNIKWPSGRIYLSADLQGLRYSFEPAGYTRIFQTDIAGVGKSPTKESTCYAFVNGSFGFPNQIFSLPLARSLQFMRLESDGHLRLYAKQQVYSSFVMVLDLLSVAMDFCDYPLACGDYGVCSGGQCSCPSLSYYRFKNERHPDAGCLPLTTISCNLANDHKLLPLNNVSYFSDNMFQSLSIPSPSEMVCKQSCLMNCSCKALIFRYDDGGYGFRSSGSCLLLSDQMLMFFVERSSVGSSAFIKIQGNKSKKMMASTIVGSVIAGFSVLSSMLLSAVIWKRCKKEEEEFLDGIPGAPKRFSFEELKVATNNFSVKLGSGGFGSVFKGKIGRETVAVKRLEGIDQGKEEFLAEVNTIGRMHHHNLVRLMGFCAEKSHRLLVYEYMCNGSLDKWIFHTSRVFNLSWKTRRNIIIAISRCLSYLHEECNEKIAHLDIKPQNILLDDKFNGKLSDFGLSKMINRDQSKVMTRMRGTRGYLAPEWLGSKITEKADIYSFGIVMMEIICGRENLDESQPEESIHLISLLQDKARSAQLSDLVDASSNDMQFHMEEVIETMKLAMWCLQVDSGKRPLMSTVAKLLQGVMNLESTMDYNFVPSFASTNADVVGSNSYLPSNWLLSGPR